MTKNEFIRLLSERFEAHQHRHLKVKWEDIETQLLTRDKLYQTVLKMEATGGAPDVVDLNEEGLFFIDMSKESPQGRRSRCYDHEAWDKRKHNKPVGNALDLAQEIGITLLDEQFYRKIQMIEPLDLKTSSWLKTPENIRRLGGAIYGDYRYQRTFIYHNGADSYYGNRGLRGFIKIN